MSNELTVIATGAEKLMQAFLEGRNANTRQAYQADLCDFATFLEIPSEQTALIHLLGLQAGPANLLVLEYRNALALRKLQSATINRRLSSLRAFVKLGRMAGFVPWLIEVPNVKHESYRDTRGVGTNGVSRMLTELFKRNDPKAIRDIALIRLFFDLGLRVSEAIGLDVSDLDLVSRTIEIMGKGRTQKQKLSVPQPTVEALKNWLALRPVCESRAVFVNFDRRGKVASRISRVGVYKLVRRLGEDLNLKTRPHAIRHDAVNAAIKAAQESEIELPSVLKFSRHKSLTTLQVYIDAVSDRQGEIATLVAESLVRKLK